MGKPVQYLLVGLPFSGKTTLAKAISERLNIPRVSLDEVKFEMGFEGVSDGDISFDEWRRVFDETDDRAVIHLKNGNSVLHETSWTKRWKRDRTRQLATDLGLETKIIYLAVPESVVRERYLRNKEFKERFDIPEEVFNEAIYDFEVPGEDEGVIVYDRTVPLEEWIRLHLLERG